MSHLTSNLLGCCPLGRKNCPYPDSYCSECIKYEKQNRKTVQERRSEVSLLNVLFENVIIPFVEFMASPFEFLVELTKGGAE